MTTRKKPSHSLKKVCYILKSFPQVSETFIVEEALSLNNFDIEFSIISLAKGQSSALHSSTKSIFEKTQVTYVEYTSWKTRLLPLVQLIAKKPITTIKVLLKIATKKENRWRYLQALPYALQVLNNKTDYIHAHFADENLRFTAILSEWTGIPFGFTAHRYEIIEDPLPIPVFSKLANQANAVVTVSQYNKRIMIEKYHLRAEQIFVAYNGIRTEMFKPQHTPKKTSTLQLINVARLVHNKGQDHLLEALYLVRKQGYSVKLCIIGDGILRDTLTEQVKRLGLSDNVEFAGAQPQNKVYQYLNSSDVLIMPSRSESFGVACIEAMSMELAVIASKVEGLPEVVSNTITGILTQPENPESLAEAIIWMHQHPEQRKEMGKKGREVVLAKFTREKVTTNLINYWQQSI